MFFLSYWKASRQIGHDLIKPICIHAGKVLLRFLCLEKENFISGQNYISIPQTPMMPFFPPQN